MWALPTTQGWEGVSGGWSFGAACEGLRLVLRSTEGAVPYQPEPTAQVMDALIQALKARTMKTYGSGFQPSSLWVPDDLGLRPRLVWYGPLALKKERVLVYREGERLVLAGLRPRHHADLRLWPGLRPRHHADLRLWAGLRPRHHADLQVSSSPPATGDLRSLPVVQSGGLKGQLQDNPGHALGKCY